MKSDQITIIEEQMAIARKSKDWKQLLKLSKQHASQSFKDNQDGYDRRAKARQVKLQRLNDKTAPIQNKAKQIKSKLDYALDAHVPCPRCKSKNTSLLETDKKSMRMTDKAVAGIIFWPLMFFVGKRKHTHGECFNCKYKWAIN